MFKQKKTPLVLKTTRVEALLVTTLVDSNLPLLAADKFMKTLKEMFPDSEIARSDAFLTEYLNFLRNPVFGPSFLKGLFMGRQVCVIAV